MLTKIASFSARNFAVFSQKISPDTEKERVTEKEFLILNSRLISAVIFWSRFEPEYEKLFCARKTSKYRRIFQFTLHKRL